MSYIFEQLAKVGRAVGVTRMKAKEARDWFREKAKNIANVSGTKMMSESDQFIKANKIGATHVGQMIMFFYDPTTKEQLPYYDRFPLIFPIEENKPGKNGPGFLGINMHYLSPMQRAKLMDALYTVASKPGTDKQKLKISYQILKGASNFAAFRPCVKHYLYQGVKSKFSIVPPKEWDTVLMLPLERFEKGGKNRGGAMGMAQSKQEVWADSQRAITRARRRSKKR